MPNVEFERDKSTSIFQRAAISAWRTPSEASMYGSTDVLVDNACDFIDDFRATTGQRLTLTHLVARGIAQAFAELPAANNMLRFGRLYRRKTVGVSLAVLVEDSSGKPDLTVASLRDVASKSLAQIVKETEREVKGARRDTGSVVAAVRKMLGRVPVPLLRATVRSICFLSFDLNLDLRKLGLPRDPFGSVLVTNVGSFGLSTAHAPLVPQSRLPMIITVGAVQKTPVVVDDEIVIRRVMRLNVTIDHRSMDGYFAAQLTKTLTRCLENPRFEFGDAGQSQASDFRRHRSVTSGNRPSA